MAGEAATAAAAAAAAICRMTRRQLDRRVEEISISISRLQLDRGVAEAGRAVAAAGSELNAQVESLGGRTGRALDTLTDQWGSLELYPGPYSFGCVGRGSAELRESCLGGGATCLGARVPPPCRRAATAVPPLQQPPPCGAARQEGEELTGTELKGEGLQGEGLRGEEREAQAAEVRPGIEVDGEPAGFPGGAAPTTVRDMVEGAAGLVGALGM